MTIKALIAHLETLDPNLRVVVPGYEGGYADVHEAKSIKVHLDVNTDWYYGPHEMAYEDDDPTAVEVIELW